MSSVTQNQGVAQLVIVKHETPEQESVYKNGENKNVHTVIKAQPFTFELGLAGNFDKRSINFNTHCLEATLVYDAADLKPVHYVARRPVEYDCTVLNPEADKLRIDCSLSVLSSQHEGAYFRLRFTMRSRSTGGNASIETVSDPMRVVSKQLQLKKFKEERRKQLQLAAASQRQAKATVAPTEEPSASKKRPFEDTLQETLSRIEAQQQTQQNLITNLFQTVMSQLNDATTSAFRVPCTPGSSSPVSPYSSASPAAIFATQPPAKKRRMEASDSSDPSSPEMALSTAHASFERHLRGLLDSFSAIEPSVRTRTISSAVSELSRTDGDGQRLSEMLDAFSAALPDNRRQLHLRPAESGEDEYSETWLSTEDSSPATSPRSPGDISVFSLAGLPVGDMDLEDKLYAQLFSNQSWVLDNPAL